MRREEIEVNTEHLKLRTVLFILAVVIAVSSFTVAITRINRKSPGYHRVEATNGEEQKTLNDSIDFEYLFSGSGASVRVELRELQGVYGEALVRAAHLLDAETRYPGVANLATLNQCQGQDVTLSGELFAVLADAWEKTQEGRGYSMFAGPVYAEWNSILLLEDPEDFDPSVDPEEAERIAALAAAVSEADCARFQIVDETQHIVRFGVGAPLAELLEDLELRCPVLDLNALHDAYLLRLIADELEAKGYHSGYLSAKSGVTVALSEQSDGDYRIYGLQGEDPVPAAKTPVIPGSAFCALRAFAGAEDRFWFYTVEDGETTLYRHPYFTASGEQPQALRSAAVLDERGDVAAACYDALRLFACADADSAAAYAGNLSRAAAWTLGEEDKTVRLNAKGADCFENEDYGWSLQPAE